MVASCQSGPQALGDNGGIVLDFVVEDQASCERPPLNLTPPPLLGVFEFVVEAVHVCSVSRTEQDHGHASSQARTGG